jgi:hypothetical protein
MTFRLKTGNILVSRYRQRMRNEIEIHPRNHDRTTRTKDENVLRFEVNSTATYSTVI